VRPRARGSLDFGAAIVDDWDSRWLGGWNCWYGCAIVGNEERGMLVNKETEGERRD